MTTKEQEQILVLRKCIIDKHKQLNNLISIETIDNRKHFGVPVMLDKNSFFLANDRNGVLREIAYKNIVEIKLLKNGDKQAFDIMQPRHPETEQPDVDVWLETETGDEDDRDK